ARDLTTRIENSADDRCIELWGVPLNQEGSIHHRDAGDADRVFDGDPLAGERSRLRPSNVALPVPSVEGVLVRVRPVTGRSRITTGWHGRHRLDLVDQLDELREVRLVGRELDVGHADAE